MGFKESLFAFKTLQGARNISIRAGIGHMPFECRHEAIKHK
jgi:hypothetical protein